ncbi:DUF1853 family protein [Salibacteraceae bacterium]|nr:DUF1853 family protein [Salibacteraceae bacterium]MDC1220120.1 DUF1853 family protein [bacterium]MDC1304892.1 DUF1853 family protein [Salibacteraceae bacterium]
MFTPEEEIWLQFLGFLSAASPLDVRIDDVDNFIIESDKISSHYDEAINDSLMLGKRAERFLSHFLKHHPKYQILAENIQIIDQKETIGELDFLIQHQEKGLLHLELACKFYLFNPSASRKEEVWCGPNNRDFLSLKKQKLQEHQFPLLFDDRTRTVLRTLNIDPTACKQTLLFQNFSFLPMGHKGEQDNVNTTNQAGVWLTETIFNSLSFDRELFFLPKKTNWLIDPIYNREWHTFDSVKSSVLDHLEKKNSPMLWVLYPNGQTERWFVVWW